jgi:ABC-type phosphate/phosphonate transport system permease subunit
MSRSKGLAIAAGIATVLAIIFGLIAQANARSAMSYHGPAQWGGRQDASALAAVPTAIAGVLFAAGVVCAVLAVALRKPPTEPKAAPPADEA